MNIGVVNEEGNWVKSEINVHHLSLRQRPFEEGETVAEWRGNWRKRRALMIGRTRRDVEKGRWGWDYVVNHLWREGV